MKDLIEAIKTGELTRDTDDKHAGGLWDLALELAANDAQVESLYETFWEIVESVEEYDG